MSTINQMKREIQEDIKLIDEALSKKESDLLRSTHMMIDGKYQAKIEKWGFSQYGWGDTDGFNYELLGNDAMKSNLINMKSKLKGYLHDIKLKPLTINQQPKGIQVYNKQENNINNYIFNINFNSIEQEIKECESLTEEETKEALIKLKELQKIYESNETRKTKWEKAKKFLIWLSDKSVDVAIAYFPIIMATLNK